ncbi:MAG TPA: alpha/beta fold hydrolase, partial [Pirellulales bacterium]|nr:alpha/beta fold hydrolase [Pirellulales bacterium]
MHSQKRLKRLGIAVAILVALWLLSSAVVTWRLTRRSRPPFAEPAAKITWAAVEDHRLATADGQKIGAWLARGAPDRGCVLLLHGNGASRTSMAGVMRLLVAEGLTVISISLRSHGDSTGELNDFGFGARHEVVEAVRFLESQFPGRPIFIVGRSLGAAAALFAADELGDRVAGYVLEQPYNDLSSATFNRLQSHLPPPLDWVAYGGMRCVSLALLPVDLKEI